MFDHLPKSLRPAARRNAEAGHHWFSTATQDFFGTVYETGLLAGNYFVTSEKTYDETGRRYTVRRLDPSGTFPETVGEFQRYKTLREALQSLPAVTFDVVGEFTDTV